VGPRSKTSSALPDDAGHDVPRKGGWDCHGLPVEIEVEKELGLTNKHEIEAFGVAEFTQRCRDSVSRYVEDWAALTERSGVWIDTKDAYWTLSNEYIESVWWIIRQMWDKGLVYRATGSRPTVRAALRPRATKSQGYQDVVDPLHSCASRSPPRADRSRPPV
jgi:isoleucyl-tRNA synthetase